ncbi:hypothetical protein KIL84_004221 [Mauremys mutica]|uniref:Uncharacterized protein n=1 Tax=Mauremys mutica TaxID=74926 RepID=A0A9D4B768_9SAUR|nr:hypothetical protein KIL84_004221 [Mauremys mutica]
MNKGQVSLKSWINFLAPRPARLLGGMAIAWDISNHTGQCTGKCGEWAEQTLWLQWDCGKGGDSCRAAHRCAREPGLAGITPSMHIPNLGSPKGISEEGRGAESSNTSRGGSTSAAVVLHPSQL